jgi:hypothetical protein
MFRLLIFLGLLAQQAVFPPTGFSPVGAFPAIIPSISLTMTSSAPTYSTVGAAITYIFTITDTGNTTVGPFTITITGTHPGTIPNCGSPISQNSMTGCTQNYAITQADLDTGSISQSAVASYMGLNSNASPALLTAIQTPSITLGKTANPTSWSQNGSAISYNYLVTNTGNVTLPNAVTVTDTKLGTVGTCGSGSMALMATKTCQAQYVTTATDRTNGAITNIPQIRGNKYFTRIFSDPEESTSACHPRSVRASLDGRDRDPPGTGT